MKRIKLTFLLLFTFGLFSAMAQDVTITGTISEAGQGTLPAVNVAEKGTTNGTITDMDGNYTITVSNPDAVLVFSYIGYLTKEEAVAGRTSINIEMEMDVTGLEEVVVVGYGTQKKADLTGSVAVVDMDQMTKASNTNVGNMLQGRATGVTVTSDGQPGADPTIRIRGYSTFGDSNPLYVVDGVAINGSMRDLSPNDIESVQVLKDASAAAIYGSRAANGVIIVTTKQGKKNSPLKVSYKGYFGIDDVWQKIPVLGRVDYQNTYNTARINQGNAMRAANNPESQYYIDDVDTDWQEEGFKTGYRQNHNVSMTGGGESGTYAVILDYMDSQGTLVGYGPDYTRYSVRANNTMQKKWFSAGSSMVYTHSDANTLTNPDDFVAGGGSPMVVKLLSSIPTMSVYDDEQENGFGTYDVSTQGEDYSINVIGLNKTIDNEQNVDRMLVNGWGQIDFGDIFKWDNHGLKFKTLVSWDKSEVHNFSFVPVYELSSFYSNANAYLNEGWVEYTNSLLENTLAYDGKFGDLSVNALVGQTYQTYDYQTITGYGIGFTEPYYPELYNATTTTSYSREEHQYMASYLGRINLDYKNKYLLTGSIRRDGSSKFSEEKRWGNFPSFSAGWKIHEEDFFPVDDYLVSELKLRAGWGQIGNSTNVGSYDVINSLNRNMVYSFDGTMVIGSTSPSVASDLVWETKTMTNFGLDMGFLDHKITASMEYYNSLTDDIIVGVDIPMSVGSVNSNPNANAASLRNSGFEFNLSYREAEGDFKYEVSGNLSTLKNEVVKLNEQGQPIEGAYSITQEGGEVAMQYGYVVEGVFQSDEEVDAHAFQAANTSAGDLMFKDLDDDGTITENDRQVLGSSLPSFTYGINFNCEYKGIDFSVFGNGAADFYLVDNMYVILMHTGGGLNWHEDILDAAVVEDGVVVANGDTGIPRVVYNDPNGNSRASTRWLQKGDYFRISNVTLGYTFPNAWTNKVGISNARVYATVQNLYTFTGYKGYNPDFSNGTVWSAGFNYGSYPLPRTWMFGLNFDF